MTNSPPRHRSADWPNTEVPAVAAGVYVVWEADRLIYCDMSGREYEKAHPPVKAGDTEAVLVSLPLQHVSIHTRR